MAYINEKFPIFQEALAKIDIHLRSPAEITDLYDWATMNCYTRCFGHAHVPNEIAMVPLIDLINHHWD